MNDSEYLQMYDAMGNEIWVNPNISNAQFNQIFDNQLPDKKLEVIEKPTYIIYWIAGIALLLLYFKMKKK
jgi:hypothetical protein